MFLPLSDALTASGLANLVDYDGNSVGNTDRWVEIGRTDVQRDGDIEVIMVNTASGRWATLGITTVNGVEGIDFSKNGAGGDTRVVGIYTDPLVASGQVQKGSPTDSQTRFENDLKSGNITGVLAASDYDSDGGQEVYFKLGDGGAVLHAYMHGDGNIKYANYQSAADVQAFMAQNNKTVDTSTWFTGGGVDTGDGGDTGGGDVPQGLTALFVNAGGDSGSITFQSSFAEELYRTDGTQAGTIRIRSFEGTEGPGSINSTLAGIGSNRAVFMANLGDSNTELWITDGTDTGTGSLKDINPGPEGQIYTQIVYAGNGRAVFAANDGVNGRELWGTDGTPDGTNLLVDIHSGAGSSNPDDFIALANGSVLFGGAGGDSGYEIWITDGTGGGSRRLAEIDSTAGVSSLTLSDPVSLDSGRTLFLQREGEIKQLWSTDGTSAGTYAVMGTVANVSLSVESLTSLGNTAVYSFDDGASGRELWVTDGTDTGTRLVTDIFPGTTGSGVSDIQSLGNGSAVFLARDDVNGAEIWITDGTAANTRIVKDINPGTGDGALPGLMSLGNGQVVFVANEPTDGPAFWITDGTDAGTKLLYDMPSQPTSLAITQFGAVADNSLVFGARIDGDMELWYTDGSTANTRSLYDFGTEIIPGGYGIEVNPTLKFTPFGDGALVEVTDYFQGRTLGYDRDLLVTDGTVSGTTELTGLASPESVLVLE